MLQLKLTVTVADVTSRASIAGVTALPTDPAARSSLQAVANGLAAILPNPSVFSVLETAVPHSLISQLANNPAAASSFESQFAAGSTPGWFSSLPTDVRSYLHTYQPTFAVLASATNATRMNMTQTSSSQSSTSSSMSTSDSGAVGSGSTTSAGSTGSDNSQSASSASAAAASSKTSAGGAFKPTGAVAAGIVGVVGILGLAAAL